MKFITATTLTSLVLSFESLSIQVRAGEYQPIYSKASYAISEICSSVKDEEECVGIDFYDPLQSCHWDDATNQCYLQQDEDQCAFLVHTEESCNDSSLCAWVVSKSDSRPGQGHCISYKDIYEGGCAFDDSRSMHTVNDKNKCNEIKGCAWYKGDAKRKACQPSPAHNECEAFDDKRSCKANGCGWKEKGKLCSGVWEKKFLSFLVGKDAEFAKTAIEAEYGESYIVQIKYPEAYNAERISLVVDDEGIVQQTPIFG